MNLNTYLDKGFPVMINTIFNKNNKKNFLAIKKHIICVNGKKTVYHYIEIIFILH